MSLLGAILQAAGLTAYNNGGGHHVHAQSSFRGSDSYDAGEAPCVSNGRMKEEGLSHPRMTAHQQQQYIHAGRCGADFRDPGVHDTIALGALKAGGMCCADAQAAVEASREYLNYQGCNETNLPWNKG